MKLTRIGTNYVIQIKNTETLSPSIEEKGINSVKFIEDNGKKLELVISDNLSYEELAGAIAGMHGIVGYKYFAMFENEQHIAKNKLKDYNDFEFYDINSFLFEDIARVVKAKEKIYLTIILSDFSLTTFELAFKKTAIQPNNGSGGAEFWKVRNKFQGFSVTNIDTQKQIQNQKETFQAATFLSIALMNKNQYYFPLPLKKPEFEYEDSIMAYNALSSRQELQTATKALGAIYEWRKSFNDPDWLSYLTLDMNSLDIDDAFDTDMLNDADEFDEYKKYLENKKVIEDLREIEQKQRNKHFVDDEELNIPSEPFSFEDIKKIKSEFLGQLTKMISDLNLDENEVRKMLEDFTFDVGNPASDKNNSFNITKEEKESFINEVLEKYKELQQDVMNPKKTSKNSNDSNHDEIN
ncbi:Hypothetical protein MAU_5130 [Metamycoplasma auris 15026]|uniref:Uncharacterized protein n=1 Tax=Metamycoplasma auris 15026 TaxID=1188233 RepID=N9TRN5_9BACT|nr:hypothetical protein [Metamycoplasma auris]ENY68715.1 Hypothetical protein MAU_5130 [Metamycoplasma auris 15026]